MSFQILFIPSCPLGKEVLNLKGEILELEKILKNTTACMDVCAPHRAAIEKAMEEKMYQCIHFSGHCTENGEILLEDRVGREKKCSVEDFIKLVTRGNRTIQIVMLMCCHSQKVAQELCNQGMDYVIGTKRRISDEGALCFSTDFYTSLSKGESVSLAFDKAKSHLEENYLEDAGNMVFFSKEEKPGEKAWIRRHHSGVLAASNLYEYQEPFCMGRENVLVELYESLKKNRLITLYGGHGWGKHTVAMLLALRLLIRKEFPDGVFCLDLEGLKNVDSFCSLLAQEIFSNRSNNQESMSYIVSHISGKWLFVLEDVDGLLQDKQRFEEALKKLCEKEGIHVLVLHTQPMGFYDEKAIKLMPLSEEVSLSLFFKHKKMPEAWSKEKQKELASFLGGDPMIIRTLSPQWHNEETLEELLTRLRNRQEKEIEARRYAFWQEDWENLLATNKACLILWHILASFPHGFSEKFLAYLKEEERKCLDSLHTQSLCQKIQNCYHIPESMRQFLRTKEIPSELEDSYHERLQEIIALFGEHLMSLDRKAAQYFAREKEMLKKELPNWQACLENLEALAGDKWEPDIMKSYLAILFSLREYFARNRELYQYPVYYEKLVKIAREKALPVIEEEAEILQAYHYKWHDKLDMAYPIYEKALAVFEEHRHDPGILECLIGLGDMEIWEKPKKEDAIVEEKFQKAQKLLQSLTKKTGYSLIQKAYWQELEIHCEYQLARLWEKSGLIQKAEEKFQECLKRCKELQLQHEQAVVYVHLARYYRRQKRYQNALFYAQESHNLAETIESYWPFCLSYEEMANIFALNKKYQEASVLFTLASLVRKENGWPELKEGEKEGKVYFQTMEEALQKGLWTEASAYKIKQMPYNALANEYKKITMLSGSILNDGNKTTSA